MCPRQGGIGTGRCPFFSASNLCGAFYRSDRKCVRRYRGADTILEGDFERTHDRQCYDCRNAIDPPRLRRELGRGHRHADFVEGLVTKIDW